MRRLRFYEYIFLLGIDLALCWFFTGYIFWVLAIGMIVTALMSVIGLSMTAKSVEVSVQSPVDRVEKNTDVYVEIKVTNKSIFPVIDGIMNVRLGNAYVGDLDKIKIEIPVPSSQTTSIRVPIKSQYAGELKVHIDSIELHDLLNFRKKEIDTQSEYSIFVFPNEKDDFVWDKSSYEVGFEEATESKLRGSDFSDVSQVREYVPGDPIKNIHWKLTAKRGDLLVKERMQSSSQKMIIIFEIFEKNAKNVDEALDNVFTLGVNGVRNQVPVELQWWDGVAKEVAVEEAQSLGEWDNVITKLLHSGNEYNFMRDRYERSNPGQGYILVDDSGIQIFSGY